MKNLLFVVNPISGGIDKTDFKNEIKDYCGSKQVNCDIIETSGEQDDILIEEAIEKHSPDTVVACGGDGTINLIAQVLHGKEINLGIVPLGSANGLAVEFLIPRNYRRALDVIIHGNVINIDVLRINDKFMSLHLSDVGFNARLIKNFDESGSRGKLSYATHFFKVLFSQAPSRYTFNSKEHSFSRKAGMVVFANASKYGTGAVVNPDGCIWDGKFEVCIFKPYPWYGVFPIAFDFFTGRIKQSPYVQIFSTDNIKITSKNKVPLQVDGEVVGDFKEITVRMEEQRLPIIVSDEYEYKEATPCSDKSD